MKICSKCKIEKELSEFYTRNISKDNLSSICKECKKKYQQEHYIKNPYKKIKESKKYYEKNKEHKKEYDKKYYVSKANYNTFASQFSWAKDPIKNIDNFIQTKCTYCGKWYFPTNQEVISRIQALNGKIGNGGTECRLYCSIECKEECPIYGKQLYPEGLKKFYSREVQPELRQMVFERDEYTCIKCGKHQDELLNIPLHCHHIEGIKQNPIESADIDMCVTVCKTCHKKIHKQDGCGYRDLQCKKEINYEI